MKRFVSLILSVCFLFSINTVSYAANISSRKASNPVIQSMNDKYHVDFSGMSIDELNILHRQGYDGAVPIGAVEDDRTGQVPLACQLEDLRRIVADKQRRALHGDQSIVLVKTRQNGRGILLHDNGQLHVRADSGKVHIPACCLGQTGCRLLQHGQDVHIHRDLRSMGCGVKRNRIVHRRYLQVFANKKDPMGSYFTVSARCGAAVFSATHPKAG